MEVAISGIARESASTWTGTLASTHTGVETFTVYHDDETALNMGNLLTDNAARSMVLRNTTLHVT